VTRQRAAGPLRAGIVLVTDSASQVHATMPVAADELVFLGHYKDFPILPGVCLVDCAQRVALESLARKEIKLRLAEVCSARFLAPVFPGDELTVLLDWDAGAAGRVARAEVSTARGAAARLKLRFEEVDG